VTRWDVVSRLALLATSLLILACAVTTSLGRGLHVARWPALWVLLVWLAACVPLALLAVRALSARAALGATLLLAAGLQVVALSGGGPLMSDDLYRYVWDARVAASGTDPYAYPPDAPQLRDVRTPDLWPSDQVCRTLRADLPRTERISPFVGLLPEPGCSHLNRIGVRTIYPPTAQLAFRTGDLLVPDRFGPERTAQIPAALTSLALTGLLVGCLRRLGRSPAWALLYAASPLAAVEAGSDAHIDVLAALLGVGFVVVLARARSRPQLALTGVLLAAAVLVKLYPAALGVLVFSRWGFRSARAWGVALASVLTSALLYLPHVVAVGPDVLGYLPGYLRENDYDGSGRYVVLSAVLPDALEDLAAPLALLGLAVLVGWALLQRVEGLEELALHATVLLGGAVLILTPGNAWYCSLLIGTAVLARRPEWLAVVAANYCVYFTSLLEGPRWVSETGYVGATVAVVGAALVRRHGRDRLAAPPAALTRPG
jgi:hypothetical protein